MYEYNYLKPAVILLITCMHTGGTAVVIDSSRGTLKSLRVNNFDYLYSSNTYPTPNGSTSSSSVLEVPSRMQLHRAPTDNDRNGYLALWETCGLDCEMTVQRHPSLVSTPTVMPIVGEGLVLNEEYCFDGVTISYTTTATSSGSTANTNNANTTATASSNNTTTTDTVAVSVVCQWSMVPTKPINRMKLYIIQVFLEFLHDNHRKEMYVQFHTTEERDWIFHVGMVYRVGRHLQYVRSLPETMYGTIVTPGSENSILVVHIWKPWVYINSTIPCAETLIGGGFGVIKPPDESASVQYVAYSDLKLSYTQSRNLPHPVVEAPIEVFYEVIYTLSSCGVLSMNVTVDTTALVVPLPRIGLQLNLPLSLSQVRWRGQGPQECYPDRQASTVSAVHCADLTTETLHMPYVRPGENGSRSEVHWVQFTTPYHSTGSSSATGSGKDHTLRITSSNKFNFSSQRYTTEELTSSMHINDILQHPRCFHAVNIDSYLMGLGGDDSWSASVLPAFTLSGNTYQYELKFYAE